MNFSADARVSIITGQYIWDEIPTARVCGRPGDSHADPMKARFTAGSTVIDSSILVRMAPAMGDAFFD
jgi:hypothetical protein